MTTNTDRVAWNYIHAKKFHVHIHVAFNTAHAHAALSKRGLYECGL